ncbi:maleate cis-trans isomerase family protein [Pseudonocardia pini]|uniref:maleate cis-trans isomerase family protein n=1 Tax=Pseudonocardia pini TaxID=2758030 RepID=UPI0015F07998|nr:decarboxylase [Pseudonocardia pini]
MSAEPTHPQSRGRVVRSVGPPRVGLLYPTRDCGEDDYAALAAGLDPAAAIEVSYLRWSAAVGDLADLDPAGRRAAVADLGTLDGLRAAADGFIEAPDVVTLACSSCSFLGGLAHATAQAQALSTHLGIPAGSTSLAFVAGLRRLGIDAVGLASVYHPEVTAAFVDLLDEAGVRTVHRVSADAPSDRDLAGWTADRIADLVRAADAPGAAAVLLPETALHTAGILGRLEALVGKPVLTATQVTLWQALDLLGHADRQTVFRTFSRSLR